MKPVSNMETNTRTLIIGMDESEQSRYAFEWYMKNLHMDGDDVIMIYSVDTNDVLHKVQGSLAMVPMQFDKDAIMSILNYETEILRQKLEKLANLMRQAKVNGVVKSVHAHRPGTGVVKAANELNADMIIIGSKNKRKISKVFTGSTSDYVIENARMPVIVCRNKAFKENNTRKPCLLDFNEIDSCVSDKSSLVRKLKNFVRNNGLCQRKRQQKEQLP